MEKFCDAVFEGGGVRGIGYVGAIARFEQAGYQFRNVAGSSAGAIVASLLASGFTAEEMRVELTKMDFGSFKDKHYKMMIGPLAPFSAMIGAVKNFGMYSTNMFESWLAELLERKNVRTFGDLHGRLKLTATDVSEEKTLVLPDDLTKFGIDANKFSVATAVRMSMSIPAFFTPYELVDKNGAIHYIVDGGMLTNYPIWLCDDGAQNLEVPVIGFRFIHYPGALKTKKSSLIAYIKQCVTTLIESGDEKVQAVIRGDKERTVFVDTKVDEQSIAITDFGVTDEQVMGLYQNGLRAGEAFLEKWNFHDWKRTYRK